MNKENKITINNLIYALLFLVFGIILITSTDGLITMASKIVGSILIVIGIIKSIIYIYMKGKLGDYNIKELAVSLILIGAGLILILVSEALGFAIRTIIGIWALFAGINRIILAIYTKSIDKLGFRMYLITAIVMIIVGILLISGMFNDIIGILIIIYSITEIVDYIYFKTKSKNYETEGKYKKNTKRTKKIKDSKTIDAIIEEENNK